MHTIVKYIDSIRGNIEFRVGKNAQDNFDIIDAASPTDLWFHIRDHASCHIVAEIPQGQRMEDGIRYDKKQLRHIATQGAVICKQHSKYKSESNVHVMYTQIQHVVKTPIVGMVNVNTYRTIIV
jgi:predicted ribosome quality control (RQC) complex YloA/Tae2 family protein